MIKKIKTKRFMVNGENVAFRFPRRWQTTSQTTRSRRVGDEKCPRVYMFPNWPKLGLLMNLNARLGNSIGSINLRYLIQTSKNGIILFLCCSDTRSSKFQFTQKKKNDWRGITRIRCGIVWMVASTTIFWGSIQHTTHWTHTIVLAPRFHERYSRDS